MRTLAAEAAAKEAAAAAAAAPPPPGVGDHVFAVVNALNRAASAGSKEDSRRAALDFHAAFVQQKGRP